MPIIQTPPATTFDLFLNGRGWKKHGKDLEDLNLPPEGSEREAFLAGYASYEGRLQLTAPLNNGDRGLSILV